MIKKIFVALVSLYFISTPAIAATTLNVPFLTWESGKQQAIQLGGPGSDTRWKVQISNGTDQPLFFKQSLTTNQGLFIYTLDLPKNFPSGGYVIETIEPDGTKTVVAGVEVKVRETYRITEIPLDLRLLAIIFAGITAIFTVVRSRKYTNLSFAHRVTDHAGFIYRFRRERLASEGNSLAKYVALHSGEPLHRLSATLWAYVPWLAIPLGILTAIRIQFDAAIPQGPIILFFVCAVIGALDATSGIALALSLGFMHVALGNVTDIRSLVVAGTFTLAWYFPAMLSSLVYLTAKADFKKLSEDAAHYVVSAFAALVGGVSVVMSTILTDSLVINRQASDVLRWPLAAVVTVALFFKLALGLRVRAQDVQEEKLYLARVVSPGLATTLFFGTVLLVYVWTNQFSAALAAAVIISAPYFLLFLVFPKLGSLAKNGGKRNLMIEAAVIVGLTYGVYVAIELLPMAVISKSRAFILLGLVPSLLHAIYSVVLASGEFESRERDKEEAL